jgi:glycosyltransferase involved in cell wall biosynthesis
MKIAVVKGVKLCPWEAPNFTMPGVTFIGATPQSYDFKPANALYPRVYNNLLLRALGLRYFQPSLLKMLKDFDIVHTGESYESRTFLASLVAKKLVFTQYETLVNCRAYRWPQNIAKTKIALKKACLIHAPTQRAADCIIAKGAQKEKVFVQPFGVDIEKFSPKVEQSYRLKYNLSDKVVVLFVGRFVREKGIRQLIEACSMLKDKVKLVVCGKPAPQDKDIKIPKDVVHLYDIPYSEIHKLHASADIFCLPSIPNKNWEEQFGFVLVEAMASGKPIVSTNCGAIPEVVGSEKNAVIALPGDVKSLKEGIEYLADNESERKKVGERNRKRALEVYDARKVSEALYDKYKMIAGGV